MFDSEPFSLNPVQFFAIACDCHALLKKDQPPLLATHELPSTAPLTGEQRFAKIGMGWHEEGLAFVIQINRAAAYSAYPAVSNGDSVELFIDTRDVKTAGFNTRFCHHFFFLPQKVEGVDRGEITHFRTEDSHPLCDPQTLQCQTQLKKNGIEMKLFIPAQSLHGYDPKQFDRLGFTYRINRADGEPQHFAVVSSDYQIEQQPSLWGSLKLIK